MDEDSQNRRARCPLCLHPLPTDAAEGLCPSCLFRAGLEANSEADAAVGTGTYLLGEAHGRPNDVPRFAPGQPFGPYRIERLLGRGGMGEVYEVEHLEQGRHIALKVLNRKLNDEAGCNSYGRASLPPRSAIRTRCTSTAATKSTKRRSSPWSCYPAGR